MRLFCKRALLDYHKSIYDDHCLLSQTMALCDPMRPHTAEAVYVVHDHSPPGAVEIGP